MPNLTLGLGGKFNKVFLGYYVLGANICDTTCKYKSYVSYESRSVQYTLSKLTHDTLLGLNVRYQKPSDTDATYKDHVLIKSPTTWVTLPILYQRVAVDP